jgi:hypothetical protein
MHVEVYVRHRLKSDRQAGRVGTRERWGGMGEVLLAASAAAVTAANSRLRFWPVRFTIMFG